MMCPRGFTDGNKCPILQGQLIAGACVWKGQGDVGILCFPLSPVVNLQLSEKCWKIDGLSARLSPFRGAAVRCSCVCPGLPGPEPTTLQASPARTLGVTRAQGLLGKLLMGKEPCERVARWHWPMRRKGLR